MRVLVTGGAGFIGSHLCEKFIANGDEVLCVDNFFTGSRQNVAHLLDNHKFELLRQPDITKAREVLGWEPAIQLREGLTRTIAYFDKLLAAR